MRRYIIHICYIQVLNNLIVEDVYNNQSKLQLQKIKLTFRPGGIISGTYEYNQFMKSRKLKSEKYNNTFVKRLKKCII